MDRMAQSNGSILYGMRNRFGSRRSKTAQPRLNRWVKLAESSGRAAFCFHGSCTKYRIVTRRVASECGIHVQGTVSEV